MHRQVVDVDCRRGSPPHRLECDDPFNANTARFHLHLDVWLGRGDLVGLDNHYVFMVMMVVVFMAMMVVALVVFDLLVVFMMFGMFLVMTAMAWRTGRGG